MVVVETISEAVEEIPTVNSFFFMVFDSGFLEFLFLFQIFSESEAESDSDIRCILNY